MKKGLVSLGVLLGLAIGINSNAQKPAIVTDNEPGWKKIGETTASFKSQNESIVVLGADEFTAIKVKVKDAPLHVERLQIFYESGEMESVDIKSQITKDTESKVINLKHPDRDIQKVAFTYHTASNSSGDKAEVELYGLKTDQPKGKDTYRDDKAREEVDQAADEARQEADEAGDDIRRETNEAREDVNREADEAGDDVDDAADKSGNVIKEGVNDAAAAIKDEKLEDKVGPNNETVYMEDETGKFYYINDAGTKVYITALQLKEKPDQK